MRCVLVPLDGTAEAASVIPHARRYLGPAGELILAQRAGSIFQDQRAPRRDQTKSSADTGEYLHALAAMLRDEEVTVRVLDTDGIAPDEVDAALAESGVDMIACITRASDPRRSLAWGSSVRTILAHSPVPVLLCRVDGSSDAQATPPRLLVPLDGSESATAALPLAEDLAKEWQAPLWLTRVVPLTASSALEDMARAHEYLARVAEALDCDVRIDTVTGRSPATMLVRTARDLMVTDVVMASHGLTASPRFVTGGVAEALIQHLSCRIVVVPPLAAESLVQAWQSRHDAHRHLMSAQGVSS